MARVDLNERSLRIEFSRLERLMTWSARVTVPLTAIRAVEVLDAPLRHTRGGRVGFLVPGVVKVGRWGFGTGMRQLVSVRRGTPGLLVNVDRSTVGFDELLVSTDRAEELAAALASRTGR